MWIVHRRRLSIQRPSFKVWAVFSRIVLFGHCYCCLSIGIASVDILCPVLTRVAEGLERDEAERDAEAELQLALSRARMARVKREAVVDPAQRVAAALAAVPKTEEGATEAGDGTGLVFSGLTEFVRVVGSETASSAPRFDLRFFFLSI